MSEHPGDRAETTIQLALSDYFALQLRCTQINFIRNFLVSVATVMSFIIAFDLIDGASITELIEHLESQWSLYLLIVSGGYLFCKIVPFVSIAICWFRKKLPREMGVSMADDGLTFSIRDQDVNLRWSNLFIAENRSAYFARLENQVYRLPKRGFTPQQRTIFENIVRRNVPSSAVRIGHH